MKSNMLTNKGRDRFKKDCKVPINILDEPYFSQKLSLLDPFFGTLSKWNSFVEELEKYANEEEYFGVYNVIKDVAINQIKDNKMYQAFINEDGNQYKIQNTSFTAKDIYKPTAIGKRFISIDMKKANFSSLKHYSYEIFGTDTWEEFVGKFTESEYIKNSKYIREVILGNCNCKRQITYEKYLMDQLLTEILKFTDSKQIVSFSNDEIVIEITKLRKNEEEDYCNKLKITVNNQSFPLRIETFTLHGIMDDKKKIYGYMRDIQSDEGSTRDFKCVSAEMMPLVIKTIQKAEIEESDLLVIHNDMMARLINVPKLHIISKY